MNIQLERVRETITIFSMRICCLTDNIFTPFLGIYLMPLSLLLLLLILLPLSVEALEMDDRIHVSGFLSVGGGFTDARRYPQKNNPKDPYDKDNTNLETPKYYIGSGRSLLDDDPNFSADTRAGLQFGLEVTEDTSANLQIIGYGNTDVYATELSWAYLNYDITPDLRFRAGRFRLPIYIVSDYLDVGFTYPWIRPPLEVYSTINMDNLTGFGFIYRVHLDQWVFEAQPYYGSSDFKRGDFTSEFRHIHGLTLSLSTADVLFRASYLDFEFGIKPWPLFKEHGDLINQLEAVGADSIVKYGETDGSITRFYSVGVRWQPNAWLVQAEGIRRENSRGGPDVDAYYGTVSYSWFRWRPYLSYAYHDLRNGDKLIHKDVATLPAWLREYFYAVSIGFQSPDFRDAGAWTFGMNYFFRDNIVFKTEITRTTSFLGSGRFEYATKNKTNHVYSASIDIVF